MSAVNRPDDIGENFNFASLSANMKGFLSLHFNFAFMLAVGHQSAFNEDIFIAPYPKCNKAMSNLFIK